ncbi:UvrD-helicase domain-containing protein [Comamonadaceae bacterium OTU4NAUVB1]|nr:UvrD-helicase domain-containing protein [Comamonadaceae bacterium OTU4NAUVB1]
MSMNPPPPAHPVQALWCDPVEGLVARIDGVLARRGVRPARCVVLVPYAQLIGVAEAMWARCATAHGAPRFETTRNWARGMGDFTSAPHDLVFDMARDLVAAQALLAQTSFGAEKQALAGGLVELACQLAPLAAARHPDDRAAWMLALQSALRIEGDAEWFKTEGALNAIALAWVATTSYATDVLLRGPEATHVDLLIVLEGLQADPLALALCERWGEAAVRLPFPACPAPPGPARVHAAADPQDEAERAAACVMERLAEGHAAVALVATDRVLTRRIAAQLQSLGVPTHDETGWKLSTTRSAATLMGALRACAREATSDEVLDWLKGTGDLPAGEIDALETRLRREGLREWRRWSRAIAAGAREEDAALRRLTALVEARRAGLSKARALDDWLRDLRRLLEATLAWDALAADAAGAGVVAALWLDAGTDAAEGGDRGEGGPAAGGAGAAAPARRLSGGRFTLGEFTGWVRDVLEAGSFVPPAGGAASHVIVLPMQQLLGRAFDAVVMPGCDERRVPASPEPPGAWTAAQRLALGLPSREALEAAQRAAWAMALCQPRCDLLWRAADSTGEPMRPSALLQALRLDGGAVDAADPRVADPVALRPTARPAPRGDELPLATVSTSVYEDLRRCPYRFFALRQLGLRNAEEIDSQVDKRDFGNWLHAVLGHFHETLRHAADADRTARLALIEQAAERATREAALGAAEFLPFAAAWPAVRDGYLDWLRTHEAGGAVFVESEPWMRQPLGRLELVGRLDRIDRTADGRAFVIDYKTEALKTTEDRVKDPAEDTQLAFYAALMADDTLRAAYVNVGERAPGTKTVEQPDVVAARDALVDGLMTDFARIADGAPLPPLGEGAVCDHCDARGLCRRDSWSDDAVATAPQGAGGLAGDDRVGAADVGVEPPPPEAEDLPVATAPAYEHNGRPVAREDFYRIACDPRRNVAVEACAGAGKTWMLVSRIVRALLEEGEGACEPHEILAITFTRKAAGEMGARLDQWLAQFAGQTPEVLATELVLRGMAPGAAAAAAPRLKGLYRRLLDGGRPVQFRTFHAWFAGLVRNAPMAALTALGLPAHYELLEDDAEARGQAWRPFFEAVAADADALADYRALVATHGRSQIAKALGEALTRRVEFTLSEPATAVQPFGALHPSLDGLREPADALATEAARREWLARAAALGGETNKTPQKAAEAIVEVFGGGVPAVEDGAAALARLRKAFFVAAEDRLTNHLRKYGAAQSAEAELQVLCAAQAQHAAWCHQQRMTRLARLLIDAFSEVKRRNGWIDMNDIEQAAQLLLGQSALSGWVQERLDARVAHLLIDEFQDTNPLQWQALHAWLSGYSGAGARPPGVFVVGDPKQSIYRFRRAEPQVFIAAKDFVRAGLGGELLSCDHTHRNARRVVGLVNHAMRAAQAQDQFEGFRDHSTQRADGGAVQKLPAIARDAVTALAGADPDRDDGADALRWRDSLSTPRVLPETRLLQLECEQAARWVAARIAEGVAPKEIMVLARRRSRLTAMQDALRARRIATEQPEKNDLHDASEVQDVIALVDALVSPAHDLSLARALKSPLFGLDDAALVALALRQRARPGTNWSALLGLDATAPDGGADGGRDREGDRDGFDARAPAGLDEMPDFSDVPDFEEPFAGTGRDEAAVDFSDGAGAHGPASAPAAAPAPTDASAAPLAPLPPALAAAVPVLRRWRDWLRALPPHDALSAIYEDADVLARFGAAAPPTLREGVLANLRGLLGAALDIEGGRFATPYALVRALRAGGVRAPSVAGPDAVRLLTVHGAKGLEADHVLMLDCDAAAPRGQTMGVLIEWKGDQARPGRFVFVASEKTPPACAATLLRDEQAARLREELNGLYVATTRARDRLVLSSVQPARPAEGSWWLRLQGQCEPLAAPAPVRPTGHADGDATFLLKRPPRRGLPAHPTLVPPAPREPTTSE